MKPKSSDPYYFRKKCLNCEGGGIGTNMHDLLQIYQKKIANLAKIRKRQLKQLKV